MIRSTRASCLSGSPSSSGRKTATRSLDAYHILCQVSTPVAFVRGRDRFPHTRMRRDERGGGGAPHKGERAGGAVEKTKAGAATRGAARLGSGRGRPPPLLGAEITAALTLAAHEDATRARKRAEPLHRYEARTPPGAAWGRGGQGDWPARGQVVLVVGGRSTYPQASRQRPCRCRHPAAVISSVPFPSSTTPSPLPRRPFPRPRDPGANRTATPCRAVCRCVRPRRARAAATRPCCSG